MSVFSDQTFSSEAMLPDGTPHIFVRCSFSHDLKNVLYNNYPGSFFYDCDSPFVVDVESEWIGRFYDGKYVLPLTKHDLCAIKALGNRYRYGKELFDLLAYEQKIDLNVSRDYVFMVSEFLAWDILEIGDECDQRWDLLCPELASKLALFCSKIV